MAATSGDFTHGLKQTVNAKLKRDTPEPNAYSQTTIPKDAVFPGSMREI